MTDQQNKPSLNEQSFEKLLEAAFVMQEHNRKLRVLEASLEAQSEQLREQELAKQSLLQKAKPAAEDGSKEDKDYTLTLAQIVEAQHQIQTRHLDLDGALAVVAERVTRITSASGAGIGLLEGGTIRYRAGAGSPALPVGTGVPLLKAVCQANIRTGQVIRTPDVDTEFLFDPEPCRQRGIHSLVAVPIHHDGNIVGALELYFEGLRGFAEQDIHTCQLMGGLVTEAIGRDAESQLKQSTSDERSTMMAVIDKLQPSLVAAEDRSAGMAKTEIVGAASTTKFACGKCGSNFRTNEQFCGKCGAPRADDRETSSTLQSKLASAWQVQQSAHEAQAATAPKGTSLPFSKAPSATGDEFADMFTPVDFEVDEFPPAAAEPRLDPVALAASADSDLKEDSGATSTALVKKEGENAVWSSAAKARDFLELLSATRRPSALAQFWRSRRGDFYLAIAIVLVVVAIRWGVWSDSSVVATGHGTAVAGIRVKRPAPDADLSIFDKLLIGLGLAEAPEEAPQYKGNPDTQVWVDLHTALYYCPGTDLYGKTAKGKLSSQRDAQLDQFEPANRKACD